MEDKIELKPCPFCGGKAKLKLGFPRQQKPGRKQAFVQCTSCQAKTITCLRLPYQSWKDTKRFAIEAWNRRVNK